MITSAEIADGVKRNNQCSELLAEFTDFVHDVPRDRGELLAAETSLRSDDRRYSAVCVECGHDERRGAEAPLFDQSGFQDSVPYLEPFADASGLFNARRVVVQGDRDDGKRVQATLLRLSEFGTH